MSKACVEGVLVECKEGRGGGSDGARRGGGLTDATVQAHSTGSHSYWEGLVAGSHRAELELTVTQL